MEYLDDWKTSERLQELDDVANQDVEMQPATNYTIYVVVDTNILLHHLNILKNFVADIAFADAPITVICPGIVLSELDFQKNLPDLGRPARNATDWMMREVTRKDLPQPMVKGQAQRETCKSTGNWKIRERGDTSTNDDMIIDCCKYFQLRAPVVLYTGDKNLCLKCDHEGLRFISPPPPHEYTSLDLAKCIQEILPECAVYLDKIVQNRDRTTRPNNAKQNDGMIVDEDIRVQIPKATLVHYQVIECFRPLLKALVQRVGGEELANLGNLKKTGTSVSKYAPRWQRLDKPADQWDICDCLEYLQDKKKIIFANPDPPLERFLRDPYSGNGALSGVEWSANAWRAAAASLRQVGETWQDEAMLQNVDSLERYIKDEYS